MKHLAPILVILTVASIQFTETVPAQTQPAQSDRAQSERAQAERAPSDRAKSSGEKTVVESALVTIIEQVEMPAKVEGVLAAVEVKEGQMIETGGIAARIEDTEVRLTHERATVEFEIARKQAKNDLKVQ